MSSPLGSCLAEPVGRRQVYCHCGKDKPARNCPCLARIQKRTFRFCCLMGFPHGSDMISQTQERGKFHASLPPKVWSDTFGSPQMGHRRVVSPDLCQVCPT